LRAPAQSALAKRPKFKRIIIFSHINLGMKKPDPQRWVQFESFA